jgi:hypothetical protein
LSETMSAQTLLTALTCSRKDAPTVWMQKVCHLDWASHIGL